MLNWTLSRTQKSERSSPKGYGIVDGMSHEASLPAHEGVEGET